MSSPKKSFVMEKQTSLAPITKIKSPLKKMKSEDAVVEVKKNDSDVIEVPIADLDPDEVFKSSDGEGDVEPSDLVSSEATFTFSRRGYRGYPYCHLNEDGDYVMFDDGKEVVYNGSLDTDSAWNRRWCKRGHSGYTSSDSDEVSSHPSSKKPKSCSK